MKKPTRLPAYGPVVIDCHTVPWRRRAARFLRDLLRLIAANFNR